MTNSYDNLSDKDINALADTYADGGKVNLNI
jgi:hypothetical protein